MKKSMELLGGMPYGVLRFLCMQRPVDSIYKGGGRCSEQQSRDIVPLNKGGEVSAETSRGFHLGLGFLVLGSCLLSSFTM